MKKVFLIFLFLFGVFMLTGCLGETDETGTKYFIVSFDSNYPDSNVVIRSQEVKEGLFATEPFAIAREGYEFLGWFDSDDELWSFSSNKVTKNTVLYAHWEEAGESSLHPDKYLILDEDGNYLIHY